VARIPNASKQPPEILHGAFRLNLKGAKESNRACTSSGKVGCIDDYKEPTHPVRVWIAAEKMGGRSWHWVCGHDQITAIKGDAGAIVTRWRAVLRNDIAEYAPFTEIAEGRHRIIS